MPFRIKVSLVIVALLLALFLLVPLVVPIPEPQGVRPLAEVAADAAPTGGDAGYVTVDGVDLYVVRYPYAAAGAAPLTLVLLHDYAFGSYTFDAIAPELAAHGTVVAFDRPAFGLTERPMPADYDDASNPYTAAAQVELTVGLLDELGVEEAVLVGNGMGGHVALGTALAHPGRVAGLVLLDTPAFLDQGSGAPGWVLNSPQMRRLGPVFLRQLGEAPGEQLLENAWADPGKLTDEMRAAHRLTTSVADWDKALWEVSRVGRPDPLEGRLGGVSAPTLVVVGEQDATVPLEDAERLTDELPRARLVTLAECGRIPQLECPDALVPVMDEWLLTAPLARR